jgi:hypothetical protein
MSIEKTVLQRSVERLMPSKSFEESLAKLLLSQARRNLLKYQTMDRCFQKKYQSTFEQFRAEQLSSPMSYEVEQDYFDWELAITGIDEMGEEIERLEEFL